YNYDDADWTPVANDLTAYDVYDCNACTGANPLELLSVANPGITGVSGGTEPTIEYAFAANAIYDGVGNFLLNFGPVSLFDNANPTISSAEYLDVDTDGMVDTIRTTWSENVSMTGSTADDWTIVPGDMNVVFDSAPDDAIEGLTLDVLVTADPYETGADVRPSIGYNNNDANNSVVDSPLAAGTTASVTATDGAAPILVSSVSADVNGDGTVDRTVITYSDPVAISDGHAGVGFPGISLKCRHDG